MYSEIILKLKLKKKSTLKVILNCIKFLVEVYTKNYELKYYIIKKVIFINQFKNKGVRKNEK